MNSFSIALANGNLQPAIFNILEKWGIRPSFEDREFEDTLIKDGITYRFLCGASSDIPDFVNYGGYDAGFTGLDWVLAKGPRLAVIKRWAVAAKTAQAAELWLVKRRNHRPGEVLTVAAEDPWFAQAAMNCIEVHPTKWRWRPSCRSTETLLLSDPALAEYAVIVVETGSTLERYRQIIERVCRVMSSPLVFFAKDGTILPTLITRAITQTRQPE